MAGLTFEWTSACSLLDASAGRPPRPDVGGAPFEGSRGASGCLSMAMGVRRRRSPPRAKRAEPQRR